VSIVLVSAPAGSGKTTRLVRHYVELVRDGLPVDRIVAITFTRRAAAELVERIRLVFDHVAGVRPTSDAAIEPYACFLPSTEQALHALRTLASAPVSTVDSFVLALLQRFQLDAAIPCPGGTGCWIDGRVSLDDEPDRVFQLAAREEIDGFADDIRALLAHASVGDLVDALARLAQEPDLARASAEDFLDVLGTAFVKALGEERRRSAASLRADDVTTEVGRGGHGEVVAWLGEPAGRPPDALIPWILGLAKAAPDWLRDGAAQAWIAAASSRPFPLEARRCIAIRASAAWAARGLSATSDRVASAALTAARRARSRAIAAMATSGRLGYRELLLAATDLCRRRPDLVRSGYDALLVDEVQDTSPEQLALYRAMGEADVPGRHAMRVVFVGDVRQSIYGFRDADPQGWRELAALPTVETEHLTVNYRSHARLVAVHGAIVDGWQTPNTPGVDSIGSVTSGRRDDFPGAPIATFVRAGKDDDGARGTLVRFAGLLAERWGVGRDDAGPPHENETAAVLTASWRDALSAVQQLRELGLRAHVVGARELLSSRTAMDLRLWLRALVDPSDAIALAGVLKHPTVGVSDAGLARLAAKGLGRALFADGASADLGEIDLAALSRLRGTFGRAMQDVGRLPTADVLDRLVSVHRWRPVLHAGPEGEAGRAVAELDVLLEVVREIEAGGIDPARVVRRLTPDRDREEELPPVRLHGGPHVVEVTTVFQAKGLAWNHVAVLDLQRRGGFGPSGVAVAVRRRGRAWAYARIDPDRGMTPVAEPIGALLRCAESVDRDDERRRLFYVAITRARDTITVALGKKGYGAEVAAMLQGKIPDGAQVVRASEVGVSSPVAASRAPTGLCRSLVAAWAPNPPTVPTTSPTSLERLLDSQAKRALRDSYAKVWRLERGPQAQARPGLALLDRVDESVVGDVVHGWLDHWRFSPRTSEEDALSYLADRWSVADGGDGRALARWLVALGLGLRDGIPELAGLLAAKLRHEWPMIGMIDGRLITGRADLVVERPDATCVVLDFKAGHEIPAAFAGDRGVPTAYLVQLEAYRRVLAAAGKRVAEVGLVYVRGLTWVRFPFEDA
jgi:ATP-dependent helicase/nuclease subunit A